MAEIEDYRTLLRKELTSRQKARSRYSIRAFARDLGLAPSFCVQVLNGKRNLSEARATQILEKVKWGDKRKRQFWISLKYESARQTTLKERYKSDLSHLQTLEPTRELNDDEFQLIASWQHYAILELTRREDFQSDIPWIASQLRLNVKETTEAVERLIRLGLLQARGADLRATDKFYSSTQDIPSAAIRSNHRQHLQLAERALNEQRVDQRDFTGITMTIDPARLPEAKAMITEFRRQMMSFLEGGARKRVYRLNVQLFALDQEISDD